MRKSILFIILQLCIGSGLAQISFSEYIAYELCYSNCYCVVDDFDNDSIDDLVVASTFYFDPEIDYKIWMYKQGPVWLELQGMISYPDVYPGMHSITSGDVNNDNLNDLLISYGDEVMIFFQNDSGGFFSEENTYILQCSEKTYGLAAGDLNNDGLNDIAASHWLEDYIYVFYQSEDGTYERQSYYKQFSTCNQLKILDINNDGLNDLILNHSWLVSQWSDDANAYSIAIYLQNSVSNKLNNHNLYKIEDGYYNAVKGYDYYP